MDLISTQAKKEFIRYFLTHYQLKNRESIWILNYLVSVEGLLDRVHFVDDIGTSPVCLVMSTFCTEKEALLYFKGGRLSTSGETAFQDIRQHEFDDLYIQLNFKGRLYSEKYIAIREEVTSRSAKKRARQEDIELVNSLIEHSSVTFRKNWLLDKIDGALDAKDEKAFLRLSEELNTLQK